MFIQVGSCFENIKKSGKLFCPDFVEILEYFWNTFHVKVIF